MDCGKVFSDGPTVPISKILMVGDVSRGTTTIIIRVAFRLTTSTRGKIRW
jgi:hypothetical protein